MLWRVLVYFLLYLRRGFSQKVNECIEREESLDARFTQLMLANNIVCVQLPEDKVLKTTIEEQTGDKVLAPLVWSNTTVVDKKQDITAEDLVGKQIIATYEVDDIHTVFYGGYNRVYHWQGSCLINSYNSNNQLVFVMEALYEAGELLSYKQMSVEEEDGEEYWLATKRAVAEGGNQGESWTYYKDNDIKQKFDWDMVTQDNVLTLEDVSEKLDISIRTYYKGMTSEGLYNDNTGEALLILFDRKGNVDTFYQGQFAEGMMKDMTGKAWEIVRDVDQGIEYICQRGKFADGKCIETAEPVHTDLTINEIVLYLEMHSIENEWKWGA